MLDRLVQTCLNASYDLQVADARFREARALALQTGTTTRPAVQAIAQYQRQHLPPDEKNHDAKIDQFFISGFDASWELDLFGRLRDRQTAAAANVAARSAARQDLAVTLAAEVARNYFQIRMGQAVADEWRKEIAVRREQVAMQQQRTVLGVANDSEIGDLRDALDRDEAAVSDQESAIAQAVHRLSVLTVEPSSSLASQLGDSPAPPPAEPAAPANLTPAGLLQHRADVRAAAQSLIASSAVARAARAELFPRLSFDGRFSFFTFGWGVGPALSWDLFDRARVRARQEQAGTEADAAFARYQQAVLLAVEDAENAFASLNSTRMRRDTSRDAWRRAAAEPAQMRRRSELGVANRMDIAAAELRAIEARRTLAAADAAVSEAWVAVFKALGGDWTTAPAS